MRCPDCRLSFFIVMVALLLQGGCASDPLASRSGISRREVKALRDASVWVGQLPLPKSADYTEDALASLFAESADPTLDGERAESHSYALALALAASGDDRFAAALLRQPPAIRRAVLRDVSPLWTRHDLHYPRTESLLE
jgi:hypothetical protein